MTTKATKVTVTTTTMTKKAIKVVHVDTSIITEGVYCFRIYIKS